jgi:3-oxoacyl-[acyl-carrier protein] reductase
MFKGKRLLITGGSKGIGKAIVELFSNLDAEVYFTYSKDDSAAHELRNELISKGKICELFKVDSGDHSAVKGMCDYFREKGLKFDFVVYNTGVLINRTIKKMSYEDWDTVIRVNLTGAYSLISSINEMINDCGKIVFISSVSGLYGSFGQCNYSASKAGLIMFAKSLSREMAKRSISVNCVAPGIVETGMAKLIPVEILTLIRERLLLKRFAKPEEIASVVKFLCSDDASYITGQVIEVSGGYNMA